MGVRMQFKNLDHNILYCLDKERRRDKFQKTVHPQVIYKTFADIPEKDIAETLRSLDNRGLLKRDPVDQTLFLTASGKDAAKRIGRRLEVLRGSAR